MYYRRITFVFSPIKCPCVRQEAVSLSLIQLQGRVIMMIELRKLLQLLLLWLIFSHCIYRNHREMGSWIQEKNPFERLLLLLLLLIITWETGSPCLTPPERQIPSVVPGCLSVTTLHAQFSIASLIFSLICHSWTHWEINFLGFFLDYFFLT